MDTAAFLLPCHLQMLVWPVWPAGFESQDKKSVLKTSKKISFIDPEKSENKLDKSVIRKSIYDISKSAFLNLTNKQALAKQLLF
jgi:hypothetical protein